MANRKKQTPVSTPAQGARPAKVEAPTTSSLVKANLIKSSTLHKRLTELYQQLSGEEIIPASEKADATINSSLTLTNDHLAASHSLVGQICGYLLGK